MRRLVDELEPRNSTEARALEMLNSVGPLPRSETSLRRVRETLNAPSRGKSKRLFGAPLVAAGLLFIAGSAGATYGLMSLLREDGGNPSREVLEESRRPKPSFSSLPERIGTSTAERIEGEPSKAARPDASGPGGPRAIVPSTTTERMAAKASPEDSLPDPRLLHRAVEALRKNNDPKKASELLERYSRGGTGGPLEEEASALAIEAALANHDAKARELGRRYLAKYPEGRFRRLALTALGGTAGRP